MTPLLSERLARTNHSLAYFTKNKFVFLTKMRVSQGCWGTREHGQFQLGNRGTKAKYLREQGNKKRLGEHGNKALLNKNWKKKERRNRHLSCDIFFAPMFSTFFFKICLHGIAAAVELGYEYVL